MCFRDLQFRYTLNSCGQIDLGSSRPKYIRRGPQFPGDDRLFKRLDRALCNAEAQTTSHEASVHVLSRHNSNNHPILLKSDENVGAIARQCSFHYLATWHLHPNFSQFFRSTWPYLFDLPQVLLNLRSALSDGREL